MPRLGFGLLLLFTIVGGGAALIFINDIPRLTADLSAGDASLWVYTPHVAPGDALAIEVAVYGGARAGIDEVKVTWGAKRVRLRGGGADWGDTIYSKRGIEGSDSLELELEVPPDARPGTTIELALDIAYTIAWSEGFDGFSNDDRHQRLHLRVDVLSPARRTLRRALSALFALGLLAGVTLLLRRKWGWLRRKSREPADRAAAEVAGAALVFLLAAFGFAGYWFFALPLLSATGYPATWLCVVLVALWLVAPPLIVHRASRAPGLLRFAVRPVAAAYAHACTLDEVEAALRRAGLSFERRGKRIAVAGESSLRAITLEAPHPRAITAGSARLTGSEGRVAIACLHALVPLLGPLVLNVDGLDLVIDGARSVFALQGDYRKFPRPAELGVSLSRGM